MQTATPVHTAHAEEHHPDNAFYWKVGAVLFIITVVEVALYYLVDPSVHQPTWTEITLYTLSAIKFIGVVAFFMHLKFDSKLFTAFFVGGLILAMSTILAILALVGAFGGGSVPAPDSHAAAAPAPASAGQPGTTTTGH